MVKLYIRGKPWIIPVDDHFLFRSDTNGLKYSEFVPSQNTLWVQILEKTLAKMKGTFKIMGEGGAPS